MVTNEVTYRKKSVEAMKIAEVKKLIAPYTTDQLSTIIVEMYKGLPKSAREGRGIDKLLRDPSAVPAKSPRKDIMPVNMTEIEDEVLQFLEDARNQYYLGPNKIIPKSERPKWRFLVKRLFKEIVAAAKRPEEAERAAGLLEELYKLLCEACDIILFTAYDPFESVGIAQSEFFKQVLTLHERVMPKQDFVAKALLVLTSNSLNRYTLYSTLMEEFLGFLGTPDLKYMAIGQADTMLKERPEPPIRSREYDDAVIHYRRKGEILTEFVVRCYLMLSETEKALEYFEEHYVDKDPEVKLYVLVHLLMEYKRKDDIIRVIAEAQKKGTKPRDSLRKLKSHVEQHHTLPEYMN